MTETVAGALLAADTQDSDVTTVATLAFVLGIIALATLLVVFLVGQAAKTYRARVAASREEELRELVARATAAQERHALAVERAETQLADLSTRFTALERVLKDVE
jgi:hypothetical protein